MQIKANTYNLMIDESLAGHRLDKALSLSFPDLSRTRIQVLVESGHVQILPHRKVTPSTKVILNDNITVVIPKAEAAIPIPQDIALEILYEDNDLLVLNKPAGMVVHPAPGHSDDTLVNALLAHCGDSLSGIGGVKRPGIVHRLDKETSGLMVVAKNDFAHHGLSVQFSDRSLSRTYQAYVWGILNPRQGTIETLLGRHPHNRQKMAVVLHNGKEAITHYKTLAVLGDAPDERLRISLIECKLATGRTHQIRVHLQHLGHPLIGDPVYGKPPKGATKIWPDNILKFPRQALHAKEISFIHPRSGEKIHFISDLPADMARLF